MLACNTVGRCVQKQMLDANRRLGRGFGWRNLAQMRAFYLAWPIDQILQTLSAKSRSIPVVPTLSAFSGGLSASWGNADEVFPRGAVAQAFPLPWSAYVRLLSVKSTAARAFSFYEAEALRQGWSVRQLAWCCVIKSVFRNLQARRRIVFEEQLHVFQLEH